MSSVLIYRVLPVMRVVFFIICRHRLFQAFYVLLVISAHLVIFTDIAPVLRRWESDSWALPWVWGLLIVNMILFYNVSISDPGVVTQENLTKYSSVYQTDGVLYFENNMCSSCRLIKPARSKHSGMCIIMGENYIK